MVDEKLPISSNDTCIVISQFVMKVDREGMSSGRHMCSNMGEKDGVGVVHI